MEQKKKTGGNQTAQRQRKRRITLDEYKERYLQVPRITNRKPVFISEELRNRLDRLVRYHGERGMSASGFVENLLRLHLDALERNFEAWRKCNKPIKTKVNGKENRRKGRADSP